MATLKRVIVFLLCFALLLGDSQGAALKLFINLDAKAPSEALVEGFFSRAAADDIIYTRDDLRSVELHFLEEDESDPQRPFRYVDPSGWDSVKFGAGTRDLIPLGGTFTITDAGAAQTTGAIAYNASAATVQTAVRAALTTNFSTAVVADVSTGVWTIDRTATGAYASALTITATALTPAGSTGYVINTEDGTASLSEKWQIGLTRAHPILRTTGWSALTAAAVNVSTVQVGSASANKVFRVQYNADAYAGSVVLAFTGDTVTGTVAWAFDAPAADVVTAFEAHTDVEDDGVAVVRNGAGDYSIELVGAGIRASNTPALATSSNTLRVPVGLTASLSSNTALVSTLLGTDDTAEVTTEVEISRTAGFPETVVQAESELSRDLIRNTPGSSTGLETWAPMANAVLIEFDSSDIPALVPYAEGQLLMLTDDAPNLYRANGTSAGNWTSHFTISNLTATTLSGVNTTVQGFRTAITTKTADYTLTATDHTVLGNATGGAITLNLPAASTVTGQIYAAKQISATNSVTIDPNASETIDGASTYFLNGQNRVVMFQSDGSNWHVLSYSEP